jgi:hypothetical protein
MKQTLFAQMVSPPKVTNQRHITGTSVVTALLADACVTLLSSFDALHPSNAVTLLSLLGPFRLQPATALVCGNDNTKDARLIQSTLVKEAEEVCVVSFQAQPTEYAQRFHRSQSI